MAVPVWSVVSVKTEIYDGMKEQTSPFWLDQQETSARYRAIRAGSVRLTIGSFGLSLSPSAP
ncbi:MAG: hypothetical protein LBB76_08550 [Azoarcus sp.]|jgi:hypothetical protein|nr:hypothetical protein [Azoarcus sp.]